MREPSLTYTEFLLRGKPLYFDDHGSKTNILENVFYNPVVGETVSFDDAKQRYKVMSVHIKYLVNANQEKCVVDLVEVV